MIDQCRNNADLYKVLRATITDSDSQIISVGKIEHRISETWGKHLDYLAQTQGSQMTGDPMDVIHCAAALEKIVKTTDDFLIYRARSTRLEDLEPLRSQVACFLVELLDSVLERSGDAYEQIAFTRPSYVNEPPQDRDLCLRLIGSEKIPPRTVITSDFLLGTLDTVRPAEVADEDLREAMHDVAHKLETKGAPFAYLMRFRRIAGLD